jgi:hypothetical protein
MIDIRLAKYGDRDTIWSIIEPVIGAGETLSLRRDIEKADALSSYWMRSDNRVYLAELQGQSVGTYFLRPNQAGGARCALVCAPSSFQKSALRSAKNEHSL